MSGGSGFQGVVFSALPLSSSSDAGARVEIAFINKKMLS